MNNLLGYEGLVTTTLTELDNTLGDDIFNEAKSHLRGIPDDEKTLVARYIRAALRSVEGALQKDIFPKHYVHLWRGGPALYINRGRVTNLSIKQGDISPLTDASALFMVRGAMHFRSAGFSINPYPFTSIYVPIDTPGGPFYTVSYDAGFTDIDDVPDEIIAFMFTILGMLNETRELAGVGQRITLYTIPEIPQYLIDALKAQVMA